MIPKRLNLHYFLTIIVLLGLLSSSLADPNYRQRALIKDFFEQNASIIAGWAHPTATYLNSTVTVTENKASISFTYRSGWTDSDFYMDIVVSVNSYGLLNDMSVERDTAFWPPFVATTAFKEILSKIIKKANEGSSDTEKNKIVEKLKEKWDELTGKDLCFLILQYHWLDKGYRKNYREVEN